jgi:hypothetical protein
VTIYGIVGDNGDTRASRLFLTVIMGLSSLAAVRRRVSAATSP